MHEVNSCGSPYIYSLYNIILYALHVHAPQNYSYIFQVERNTSNNHSISATDVKKFRYKFKTAKLIVDMSQSFHSSACCATSAALK